MKSLLEAWVVRLAECRLKQKAGYNQHASHLELHTDPKDTRSKIFNVLWEMKKRGLIDSTIDFARKLVLAYDNLR